MTQANKTTPNDSSVSAFLQNVPHEGRRADSFALLALMQEATGLEPVMWGDSMVGFGSYRYKYASGREGDWPLTAFSPRKQSLSVYIMAGFDQYAELLARLGKHTTGVGCLYIKRLADVDLDALRELVMRSVEHMRRTNPSA
jgi:hypothetical protein